MALVPPTRAWPCSSARPRCTRSGPGPTGVADAWTASEFTRILYQLRRAGYRQPLDMQMNAARPGGSREWFSYGFAPVIWSAGGDLINRSTYRTASGVLNSRLGRALTACSPGSGPGW